MTNAPAHPRTATAADLQLSEAELKIRALWCIYHNGVTDFARKHPDAHGRRAVFELALREAARDIQDVFIRAGGLQWHQAFRAGHPTASLAYSTRAAIAAEHPQIAEQLRAQLLIVRDRHRQEQARQGRRTA